MHQRIVALVLCTTCLAARANAETLTLSNETSDRPPSIELPSAVKMNFTATRTQYLGDPGDPAKHVLLLTGNVTVDVGVKDPLIVKADQVQVTIVDSAEQNPAGPARAEHVSSQTANLESRDVLVWRGDVRFARATRAGTIRISADKVIREPTPAWPMHRVD